MKFKLDKHTHKSEYINVAKIIHVLRIISSRAVHVRKLFNRVREEEEEENRALIICV